MRAKLWLSLGAAAALTLGVSAGTLALFSAQAPTANQNYTAGTVQLMSYRDQGDTIEGPMFYTTAAEGVAHTGPHAGQNGRFPTGHWAPGDTHMRVLMVKNIGTLDVWLTGVGADLTSGSRHLAEKLEYKVTTDSAGLNVLASGTLASVIDTDQTFSVNVPLNVGPAPKPLYFFVHLPLNADNSYQAETLKVDFHVMAVQKKNNP